MSLPAKLPSGLAKTLPALRDARLRAHALGVELLDQPAGLRRRAGVQAQLDPFDGDVAQLAALEHAGAIRVVRARRLAAAAATVARRSRSTRCQTRGRVAAERARVVDRRAADGARHVGRPFESAEALLGQSSRQIGQVRARLGDDDGLAVRAPRRRRGCWRL